MASSIKKVVNLNRLRRPDDRLAVVEGSNAASQLFDTNWDELVIRFDPSDGRYQIRTASISESGERPNRPARAARRKRAA